MSTFTKSHTIRQLKESDTSKRLTSRLNRVKWRLLSAWRVSINIRSTLQCSPDRIDAGEVTACEEWHDDVRHDGCGIVHGIVRSIVSVSEREVR